MSEPMIGRFEQPCSRLDVQLIPTTYEQFAEALQPSFVASCDFMWWPSCFASHEDTNPRSTKTERPCGDVPLTIDGKHDPEAEADAEWLRHRMSDGPLHGETMADDASTLCALR